MDFFEAQDRARRATWKLVVLYITAVILIITSVYLVTLLIFGYAGHEPPDASLAEQLWQPGLFFTVSVILIFIILAGTLFRISQLRKGGSAVAEMLGGRKLEPSTRDSNERQLMNIVEEMSIASGLPVPDVYILDKEENINAFAAGFGTGDAAVGFTRGAIEKLNRDELQGVVAHEFSHIFNGDMRLNIRLIGILNGILLLHLMGMILMRAGAYSGMTSGGSRSAGGGRGGGGGGNATLAIILLGVALLIVGYIGMLFGRMIQAAISRQREYLADAAAVQYTRNPDGIAGALRKIGQTKKGGKINDGHAMEMSHLFFANSFHSALDRLFATHPPLEKRIKAIDPAFDTENEKKKNRIKKRLDKDRIASADSASAKSAGGTGDHPAIRPELILAAIGTMDGNQVNRAGQLLQGIPVELKQAAHEPLGAESLVIALLLGGQVPAAKQVPEWLHNQAGENISERSNELLNHLNNGNREWFLPLAELALPALRQMSESQYKTFRETMERLIRQDEHVSLFEFALEKMIVRQLDTAFTNKKEPKIRHHHFKTMGKEMAILLSAMAHASETDTQKAWQSGLESIEQHLPYELKLLPSDRCGIEQLDKALDEINASANPVKKYVLTALIHCMTADNQISVRERELLRAISEAIDCPIPIGVL